MARPTPLLLLLAGMTLAGPALPAEPVIHPRYNDLMTAVMELDPEGVRELLEIGKWPDRPDSNGYTPLAVATELGEAASAELLLKAGADPDRRAYNGKTPRRIAQEKRDAGVLALMERYREGASVGTTAPPP